MGYDFFLRNLQYCTLSPASSFCSILFKKIKQLDMSMLITEKKFGRGQSRIEGVALWVCKVAVVCKLMPVHCTERINNEQASDVLAGQPPLSVNISALNSESTPKTIPPLHISVLSNMTSTESADTDMLDMSPKATSATSTNLKTIPSWMTDARKWFESVFTAANEKSIVELWLWFGGALGRSPD